MALTDAEIEELRFHTGWGNIDVGAYPHTPDGFYEVFHEVVSDNLTTGTETTVTASVSATGSATCTPASMTDISAMVRLVIDAGDDEEVVVVRSTTATTFTATFAKTHTGPFPVATLSGVSRARSLLHRINAVYTSLTGTTVTQAAGLKMVGQGEVEWFGAGATLSAMNAHLLALRRELSSLIRVPLRWDLEGGRLNQLETY